MGKKLEAKLISKTGFKNWLRNLVSKSLFETL